MTLRFRFRRLTQADAEAMAAWHYPEPYTFYDWTADPDDLAVLLDPARRGDRMQAVEDSDGELIGFFSFKPKEPETIESGSGPTTPARARPGLCRGGLDQARERIGPQEFSLAVATFNERAITVYERAGFTTVRTYMHHTNGGEWEFVEMRRPA